MRICPKCHKEYSAPPAVSRIDGTAICPTCGSREAMDSIGIGAEEQEKILEIMRRYGVHIDDKEKFKTE